MALFLEPLLFKFSNMEIHDFKSIVGRIQDVKVGMFTTMCKDNQLRSRPMTTCEVEEEGFLWFFTSINSKLIDDLIEQDNVNISYTDINKNLFISIKGQAILVRSKTKIEKLWNPLAKAWFPKGLEDPELVLVKIQVTQAEIWDSGSSKIVILAKIIKAIVTGEEYKDPTAHQVINL